MTFALSALDRIVVLLTGLLLIAAGVIPVALYWRVPWLSEALLSYDRGQLASVPGQNWYATALIAALAALIILGLWFILANIRNRAFSNRGITPRDADHGETVLNVQRIAEAACTQLEASPMVDKAASTVAMVGRRPTATFTVTADPGHSFADVARLLEQADEDFALACPGVDIDTVYKLQLDRITS
ncbi:hypothetical protein [Corynebacterium sp. UBA2622]|uniref:hypothetical protein n=1 Tax=Corynebacterium sp. UBA2622 TaxID=1946393 RepID=UPI0025B7BBBF|nr:hypothetical protein [Corynebacterium sp. UBA2622]